MTRRLAGYRGMTVGVATCFVALAAMGPAFLLSAAPARAEFREVDIVDDDFQPPEIIVRRGDTVVWIHRGVRPHGVRASDGSFDSSPGCSFQNGQSCMRNGDRYSRTFDEAGTFTYYCPVHGSANGVGMAGQITVASGSGGGGGGSTTSTTSPPPTTQTTRSGTTTVRPPPPGGTTTQSPGVSPPPPPPPPSDAATEAPPPEETDTTAAAMLRQSPADLTTTSILAAPMSIDGDDSGMNILILTLAVVGLTGALSATAWYYRPRPGPAGPPPDPPAGP